MQLAPLGILFSTVQMDIYIIYAFFYIAYIALRYNPLEGMYCHYGGICSKMVTYSIWWLAHKLLNITAK